MSAVQSLCFDIESGPIDDDELKKLLPPFDPSEVKCGNLGADKAREKIEQARANHEQNFKEKAALSSITGRVLAIGYIRLPTEAEMNIGQNDTFSMINDDLFFVDIDHDDELSESHMLTRFWKHFTAREENGASLIGHNIFGFDLPFLLRRSWLHDIDIPEGIFTGGRYWNKTFIDTMKVWTCGAYNEFVKLDQLDKFFGGKGKTEGIGGADFARLYEAEETRATALAYLKNDLVITHNVARKMGLC